MENRFNDQAKFTETVFKTLIGSVPTDNEVRITWTKEYLLCIVKECMEVLDALDWKHHRHEDKIFSLDNLGIELIDIQKFLWGLFRIWGFSYDDFISMYDMKSMEVEAKWYQEHELPNLKSRDKVCLIDIDGVISDYPKCYHNWLAKNGYNVDETLQNTILDNQCKNVYRSSGYKKFLPIINGSIEALQKLKDKGYTIVLLTNRPVDEHHRIFYDTIYWLRTNNIPYDYIHWGKGKKICSIHDKCNKIEFAVDDDPIVYSEYKKAGVKAYLIGSDINTLNEIDEIK